jgi:hypothetical protein
MEAPILLTAISGTLKIVLNKLAPLVIRKSCGDFAYDVDDVVDVFQLEAQNMKPNIMVILCPNT